MLSINTLLTPDNRSCTIIHFFPITVNMLAITLHIRLLQVRGQVLEVLVIGNYCLRVSAEEVVIPDAQQAKNDRDILFQRRCPEVLVHRMRAGEKFGELVIANCQGYR